MKKLLLLLLILLPCLCNGQEYLAGHFAENRIDEEAHDTIKRTYWQVMERAGLGKKLKTYYRMSRINGKMFIDVKVIEGNGVFVVARDAELKLVLETGSIVTLHNTEYKVSCKGCGARGNGESSSQGVMLTFPIDFYDIRTLLRNYVVKIGVNSGEDYMEKWVNQTHSQLFMDELYFALNSK